MSETFSTTVQPTFALRPTTLVRAGQALTALPVLFLLFDAAVRLLRVPIAIDANAQLGYSTAVIVPLGILEIALLILST
jgi:DoxX-like family